MLDGIEPRFNRLLNRLGEYRMRCDAPTDGMDPTGSLSQLFDSPVGPHPPIGSEKVADDLRPCPACFGLIRRSIRQLGCRYLARRIRKVATGRGKETSTGHDPRQPLGRTEAI